MLIHDCCGLRAAVTLKAVEILCGHAMLAKNALEVDASPQRFGGVVAHTVIVVPSNRRDFGHWVLTFGGAERAIVTRHLRRAMPNLIFRVVSFREGMQMKRQYLHLSVYRCDTCQGPVVTASLAVRENEISKETGKRELGARCLACGRQQIASTVPGVVRHFPPTEWQAASTVNPSSLKAASVEAISRASKD